jgi:peptide/nickel transport system substrate-binding protein
LKFTLLYPDTENHRAVAEAIQAAWADLGADVALEPLPYDQLVSERLVDRNFQAALVDLDMARSPDPDPYPFWDQAQSSGTGQNYSQWDNRMASEYLEQARILVDLNERAKMYRNFQVVFQEELPALPLFYPVYTYAISKDIQGVRIGPLFDPSDRFNNVTDWHLAGLPRVPSLAAPTPTTQP